MKLRHFYPAKVKLILPIALVLVAITAPPSSAITFDDASKVTNDVSKIIKEVSKFISGFTETISDLPGIADIADDIEDAIKKAMGSSDTPDIYELDALVGEAVKKGDSLEERLSGGQGMEYRGTETRIRTRQLSEGIYLNNHVIGEPGIEKIADANKIFDASATASANKANESQSEVASQDVLKNISQQMDYLTTDSSLIDQHLTEQETISAYTLSELQETNKLLGGISSDIPSGADSLQQLSYAFYQGQCLGMRACN